MLADDLLFDARNAVLGPIIEWVKDIGAWRVANYSGVSKRRITTIVKHPEYRKNLDFNEFISLYVALSNYEKVYKRQNYYAAHLHHAERFRFRSSRKTVHSSTKL
jgi:uncharacterized Fe-S cluster-containing radical SAM superfamily enzyme